MAATDIHAFTVGGLSGPFQYASDAIAQKSDTVDLTHVTSALQAADAGNVVLITVGGSTATLAFAAGQIMPIRVTRVKSTSTTVSGLTALW